MSIACGLTYYIHRSTLTLCYLAHMLNMLLVNEQAHALLTLIGNDFLCAQCLVADRQLRHVNATATLLNKL